MIISHFKNVLSYLYKNEDIFNLVINLSDLVSEAETHAQIATQCVGEKAFL